MMMKKSLLQLEIKVSGKFEEFDGLEIEVTNKDNDLIWSISVNEKELSEKADIAG